MKRLRLLSFNIHGGRGRDGRRDLDRINALLDQQDIDIAVMQEVEMRSSRGGDPEKIDALVGSSRPHRLNGPSISHDDGWYGNLIASRYPILRGCVHNLDTRLELEPRSAVDALIETPFGKLRIIGTHLSLSSAERWSEVSNLLNLIDRVEETEKNPLFLLGDLNEWRSGSRLLKHLNKTLKALPCGATFPSVCPLLRLDRAWHDAPHLTVRAKTLADKATSRMSDHLPIMIEIDFDHFPSHHDLQEKLI